MFRFQLEEPPPQNAQVYKNLKWTQEEINGAFYLKFWLGKSKKPKKHYRFSSLARLEQYLDSLKKEEDSRESYKSQRKEKEAQALAEIIEKIKVGTLLHYSWGYEQTNCDFFQVVERKGKTVTIRPIAGEEVPGSCGTHGMSCKLKAVPNKFIGEERIVKRIRPFGLAMDHGIASITSPEQSHYCSWYA